ncbi:hypothetical protein NHX12_000751 [Muraenolepis orangiensis]|uniref:Orn/DAP/Arg decarboxylase 2 N-terminal domain-containing protein n=1 Tax=Muraenolepis orangiensis TaxID=630683 RepID=A0A9Q0IGM7_9TELE|nr:hypothetical protein NHX12_000751 [Muraenolepis orangiensis]
MKGLADEPQYSVDLLDGGTLLHHVVSNHISEQTLAEKNAFFVADLGVVMRQHVRWRTSLPQIRPYYTVRCNSSPALIEVLAALGTGFICTNKSELEMVQSHGVPSEDIIYSGGCKQLSHIKYAAKSGVDLLVCDNEAELRKIARCHPTAKLLLQVWTEASGRGAELSVRLGCTLKDCRRLLESAVELGVQVVGVRFNISSCDDEQAYAHAMADARCVFDMGEDLGFNMNIINRAVMSVVDLYFPPSAGVCVAAEPGAYLVAPAFTLAVNVVSKEVVARDLQDHEQDEPSSDDEPEFQYYISEGVYGSFSCKLADTVIPVPAVHKSTAPDEPVFSSSLWGPSGDDMDQVVEQCVLPELYPGDWLVFADAGGFGLGQPMGGGGVDMPAPPVYYVISTRDWFEMQDTGITQEINLKNFSLVPYFFKSCQSGAAFSVPA